MDAVEKPWAAGPALLLVSLILATLAPPGLTAQPWKARSPAGDLYLLRSADGYRVESDAGERTALPLPADARVNDFRAAGDGWLTAAVVDGEGGPAIVVSRGVRPSGVRRPGIGSSVESLAVPARGDLLREPLLLVRRAELAAVVWLEGEADDRLAVRAARFEGGEWRSPETISPPGRGTQIALTAAALADGSWLVAWAAFDGDDDEILWSRSTDGAAWSPPRRVAADNRVPDVTPHLRATAGGALVAWSRYDGNDYRVAVARFDGSGWSEPATVGVRGSVDPAFDDAERPLLVYRRAVPRGWVVAELGGEGGAPEARPPIVAPEARPAVRVLRQAAVDAAGGRRPIVSAVTAEGATLRWEDGRSSSAAWRPAPEAPR